MCGIAGLFDPHHHLRASDLDQMAMRMAETIAHRGPDDSGTWSDARAGVAFGHRRLAVVDLSTEGHQPMLSADGRWVLSYNGEIYNHLELRSRLEKEGTTFRGRSDTEVLVEAIARWGVRPALAALNGMFAFSAWDRSDRRLVLARDRLGEKPLYYGRAGSALVFGSELRCLRAHPSFPGRVDRDALASYFRLGYVPAPMSIHEDVAQLPPGHLIETTDARPSPPQPYWLAADAARAGLATQIDDDRVAVDEIDRLLRDSVAMRMVADVPVGAFLSGGIDSSLVVAVMQMIADRPVRTFTIGFDDPAYDESGAASAVARTLGTDHTEVKLSGSEALELVPTLASIHDEPFADSSLLPATLIATLARRDVTVALTGDGGDELFEGYARYLLPSTIWRRAGWLPRPLRAQLARAITTVPARTWDAAISRFGPVLPASVRQSRPGGKLHKVARALTASGPDAAYEAMEAVWSEPVVLGAGQPVHHRWLDVADPTSRAVHLDMVRYLPDDVLAKVDRAAMSVSLETRLPLLDHRLVELSWRISHAVKTRDGLGKWPLRSLLARYLPPSLTDRPKMGFGVPIGAWLRGPLRPWAETMLDNRRLASDGYLDVGLVRATWSAHLAGHDHAHQVWSAVAFQAWLDDVHGGSGARCIT